MVKVCSKVHGPTNSDEKNERELGDQAIFNGID